MQPITFTAGTVQVTGQIFIIPGFENLDLVLVQDGFFKKVYELSTGLELAQSNAFTDKDVIVDIVGAVMKKNLTDLGILNKIYSAQHNFGNKHLKVINDSPKYKAYEAQQIAEYDNAPFAFQNEERAQLQTMLDQAIAEDLANIKILQGYMESRLYKKHIKANLEFITAAHQRELIAKQARNMIAQGLKLPADLRGDFKPKGNDINTLKEEIMQMRKRDIVKYIPDDILHLLYKVWKAIVDINNDYGYHHVQYTGHPLTDTIRLGILTKKGDDTTKLRDGIIDSVYQTAKDIGITI